MSLRDELHQIHASHGRLTPALVVDEARSEDHPLHDRFEWDDGIAGEAYRRTQARELIRSVKISFRDSKGEPAKIRAFHAARWDGAASSYKPTDEVIEDPVTAGIVLADMRREWRAMRRRYESFSEFWEMVRDEIQDTA